MKDNTYKPPHASRNSMTTHFTSNRLNILENQFRRLDDKLDGLNEQLNKKLDEKLQHNLANFENMLTEKLTGMTTQGIPKEHHWTTQQSEPHKEETSNS